MKEPTPYYRSFDDFYDHIKEKDWSEIEAIFRHEYDELGFLQRLPQKQRLNHPLLNYEDDLSCFFQYFYGRPPPSFFSGPLRERIHRMLERIRAKKEGKSPT